MTRPSTWLSLLSTLVWSSTSHARPDEHRAFRMPNEPQRPDPGVRITQLLVERNGKHVPVTAWSPCASDRGDAHLVAIIATTQGTFFDEHTLMAVLTIDAMVAPPEYKVDDLEQAERDLHWSTLQAIQTPSVQLVGTLRPSSKVSVRFPPAPIGQALASFDPEEDGLRVLALLIRVQIADRSLDRLVDYCEVVRVNECGTARGAK